MEHCRKDGMSFVVALAAAYILILQSVVGALALGAGPKAPLLDAFGNPLCITSADHGEQGPARHHDAPQPDCCTAACSTFAPAFLPARLSAHISNPLPMGAEPLRAIVLAAPRPAPEHDPGSPRAPPALA